MNQQTDTLAPATQAIRKPKEKFRTDIQALRALAVVAVVVNHLWPQYLPGGYVGVDIFFVISGFLITRHLVGELRNKGRVRFAAFYARRMRRLLPAALLVAVVGITASWLIQPYSRWVDTAWETLASVFYGENWLLAAKAVDYSANHEMATPVQHYWSLSVEEQFYLVWPLLLAGAFLLALRLRKSPFAFLTVAMGTVAALSLAYSVYFTVTSKNEAYFVTTTRAWEFATGGLIAIATFGLAGSGVRARAAEHPKAVRLSMALLAGAGTVSLLVSLVLFNEQTLFPGAMALIPVLGTGAIVLSGSVVGGSALPGVGFRPVQFLGDVSYSLYLWHWPLIVLAVPLLGHELRTREKLVIGAVSVMLAALTKRFVEDPGRSKLFRNSRPRVSILSSFGAMAVAGALCATLLVAAGFAQTAEEEKIKALENGPCYGARSMSKPAECTDPFGPPLVANVGSSEAPWFSEGQCRPAEAPLVVQGKKYLDSCDFSEANPDAPTVWLIGDSHAEQWKAAVFELARKFHWKLQVSLLGGCPVIDAKRVAFMDEPTRSTVIQQRCLEWSKLLSDRVLKDRPDMLFLSTFASKETVDDGSGRPQLEQYADGVGSRLGSWARNGTKIFLIRDTPLTLGRSTSECLLNNPGNTLNCSTPRIAALPIDPMAEGIRRLGNQNAKVLDLSDQFCDSLRCYAAVGGLHVFFDKNHVSRSYIRSLVPALEARFLLAFGARSFGDVP